MIRMNQFGLEPEELRLLELAAAERVIRSGWYILGKEVIDFETKWAAECEAPFAVGVGNGMDAIEIGLRCLGVGAGDEVITTPMTAFATVLAIARAGAVPVLADIDRATGLLSIESAKQCVTPRTRAIVLVHLYGQVRDVERWASLCTELKIELIEDCAQSHGAMSNGRAAGTFGRVGAFSFYPTKNLGALGDGGALICREDAIAERAKALRNYGQTDRYHHPFLGMNSRLDEMQAAILAVRLNWLERFTERRREICERYESMIHNANIELLIPPAAREQHARHLFVVLSPDRDRLASHLRAHDIESLSHYPVPVHQQTPFTKVLRSQCGLANAERHAAQCLSLPCHPFLANEEVDAVIEAINAFN